MKARSARFIGARLRAGAAIAVAGAIASLAGCGRQPNFWLCAQDRDIPAATRSAIDRSAMSFARAVAGPDPAAAYPQLTADARRNLSRAEFLALVRTQVAPHEPFQSLRLTHSYLVRGVGQRAEVQCQKLEESPDWTMVVAAPIPQQAHIIVEGHSAAGDSAFVICMMPEAGEWRVRFFFFSPKVTIAGKSAREFRNLAKAQLRRHHDFNAYVLYSTAIELCSFGADVHLDAQWESEDALRQIPVPSELAGKPPRRWQFGGSTFRILKIVPAGLGGKIYLKIAQESSPWPGDAAADLQNHELISDFAAAHPEYSDAFAGLIAEAVDAGGNRRHQTVLDAAPARAAR